MTRLTPIDTPHAYELSELVLRVSECVEAVSEWCRSVSIDTSVGSVECVQVSIDTGVKVSSRGSRIKSVAEDQGQNGLKMASLTFDIVQSDIDLIMRDCTAHHICRQHGLNVPPAIAEAHQVQVQTPPRVGSGSTASSPGSSASHAGSASSGMQPQFVEAINILRGIKRTMQARKMWVEEDEQSQCAQM